jgi:hypothetical protein
MLGDESHRGGRLPATPYGFPWSVGYLFFVVRHDVIAVPKQPRSRRIRRAQDPAPAGAGHGDIVAPGGTESGVRSPKSGRSARNQPGSISDGAQTLMPSALTMEAGGIEGPSSNPGTALTALFSMVCARPK